MRYDLHVHSTLSDGEMDRLSILEVANLIGLEYIAFTDHNVVFDNSLLDNAYMQRFNQRNNTSIINGTEIDCIYKSHKLHILYYYMNGVVNVMNSLNDYEDKQRIVIRQMIKKIYDEFGIVIDYESLLTGTDKREIISWLMKNGFGDDPNTVADKYTSRYSRCYVEMPRINFEELC
jgi:hypothetical protein